MAPGYCQGTRAMKWRLNHSIDRLVASSLTLVGLTRASMGPAMRVMLRGCAGWRPSAITATAPRTATHGWQTATTCDSGPIAFKEADDVVDEVVQAERSVLEGNVAGVVPVGDVDIVLGEHVRTVPRSRVAKCPDIGATRSTLAGSCRGPSGSAAAWRRASDRRFPRAPRPPGRRPRRDRSRRGTVVREPVRATISQAAAAPPPGRNQRPEELRAHHEGGQRRHAANGEGEVGVRLVGLVDHTDLSIGAIRPTSARESLHPTAPYLMLHRDKNLWPRRS